MTCSYLWACIICCMRKLSVSVNNLLWWLWTALVDIKPKKKNTLPNNQGINNRAKHETAKRPQCNFPITCLPCTLVMIIKHLKKKINSVIQGESVNAVTSTFHLYNPVLLMWLHCCPRTHQTHIRLEMSLNTYTSWNMKILLVRNASRLPGFDVVTVQFTCESSLWCYTKMMHSVWIRFSFQTHDDSVIKTYICEHSKYLIHSIICNIIIFLHLRQIDLKLWKHMYVCAYIYIDIYVYGVAGHYLVIKRTKCSCRGQTDSPPTVRYARRSHHQTWQHQQSLC